MSGRTNAISKHGCTNREVNWQQQIVEKSFFSVALIALVLLISLPAESREINASIKAKVVDVIVKQSGVNPDLVTILKAERKEWPNSALGCPKKGMSYLQVISPGFRVFAEANDKHFVVHTSLTHAVLCSSGGAQARPLPKREVDKEVLQKKNSQVIKAIQLSRQELLKRDDIDKLQIRVALVKPSKSESLEDFCGLKEQSKSNGFLVRLRHNDEIYSYFSDGNSVTHCETKNTKNLL